MPTNWLPIEDWLARVLQSSNDVKQAVVSTDGLTVSLWLWDGRRFYITIDAEE